MLLLTVSCRICLEQWNDLLHSSLKSQPQSSAAEVNRVFHATQLSLQLSLDQWRSMVGVEPAMPPFCRLFSCVVSSAFAVVFFPYLLLKAGAETSAVQEPQWLNSSRPIIGRH